MNSELTKYINERIFIPYIDPKKYDNTELEELKYDERCRQIAREMLFAFSNVNSKNR